MHIYLNTYMLTYNIDYEKTTFTKRLCSCVSNFLENGKYILRGEFAWFFFYSGLISYWIFCVKREQPFSFSTCNGIL